jgi:hypothetical protein
MDEKKLEDVAMGAMGSGVNTWHGRRTCRNPPTFTMHHHENHIYALI